MRHYPKRSRVRTVILIIAGVCLLAFGIAEGKALKLSVRDSVIDIEAHDVPLADILNAISAQTGLSLKLGTPLTETVAFDLKALSLEEALKCLLVNHNYALSYRKTNDNRFLPEELRVVGVGTSERTFPVESRKAIADQVTPPDEPYQRKFDKTWFGQQFGRASTLSDQITARHFTEDSLDRGILITGIAPESPLQKLGLRVGDLIQNVDGKAVRSAQEFLQILSSFEGDQPMRIERAHGTITSPIYINLQ